ncbi:hypothetical protein [Clostridium botulinum]|uniref:hypothetical protein n=1 Tax=Clostridium botulinum TaxID=1491 RepID=UPI0019670FB1|nr:hypothetical protein [Clostridium botulinum]MBN1057078.1 hypothetical protein [Clostridium botulinum]
MNDNLQQKKFYQTTWFTIVMLVLFCPIGIFFLWKNKIFNKVGRGIITLLFIPIIFINIFFWIGMFSGESKSLSQTSDKQVEKRNEEAKLNSNEQKEKDNIKNEDKNVNKKDNKTKDKEPNSEQTIQKFINEYKLATEVSIVDLQRNPDKYKEKIIVVKGIVNQVLEGNKETPTNIKVYDEITENEVILLYNRKEGEPRYLDGDYIWATAQFDSIQGMDMLDGHNEAFPIANIQQIYDGNVADAMVSVNEAVKKVGSNYELIYINSEYVSSIEKNVYIFKVYDKEIKAYKDEAIAYDGYNVYWYNVNTKKIGEIIYKREYQ